ncbi:hypothetical protein CDV55_108717 [Aspergillus turcosus]|nr:hypothetical protein CDV55_108717 [Aspergillus turcosus]
MASDSTPSKGGGLSLYANLLDPSSNNSPGTISRAPVVFKQASEGDSQTDDSAAKKQQLTLPKTSAPPAAPVKTTLADWAATDEDDVNGFYVGEKRQRGGRKKRKKNREAQAVVQNWDDIYDPSRPNIYEEYKHSDEQIAEVREWKDRLYAHRMARSPSRNSYSDDESTPMNRQFAPPKSFAPPPNLNDIPPAPLDEATGDDAFARRARMTAGQSDTSMPGQTPPPPPPPPPEEPSAPIPDDPTGEDAYLRRLQMATGAQPAPQPPPPPPPRPLDALQPASATISRAPVRYTLPPPPEDIPATEAELEEVFAKEEPAEDAPDEEDGQRSLRPGQKGFAERLLAKYGWTKGSGLGATGSGIVKPLQVKVEKQKKRPDSEGGGFVTPAGRGKIIGGKRKAEEEEGKFGRMSEVIILKGMLDGMDVDAELEGDQDGGLMQEIGEECSEKYGRVERVFISRESGPPVPVFVKFTNQLSALRAVNALEGRVFNGNTITARFYDTQKFEQGIYDDR